MLLVLQGLRAEHALSREGGRPWRVCVLHAACLLAGTASRRTCVSPATRLGTSHSARVPARMCPCFCEWQAPQAMAGATGGAGAALARFEAENAVVDADADAIYHYGKPRSLLSRTRRGQCANTLPHPDRAAQNKLREQKPWATDPRYFKNVKISALA